MARFKRHDFLRQVPTRETQQNLKEIVRQIQAHGAMVAIAGIKLGFFTDEYGAIFEETAVEYGAIYIPHVMKGISMTQSSGVIRFTLTAPVTI
ncbi:MAG TPA: hypothetical protein VF089_16185 [Candidatus Binatia bacterium]